MLIYFFIAPCVHLFLVRVCSCAFYFWLLWIVTLFIPHLVDISVHGARALWISWDFHAQTYLRVKCGKQQENAGADFTEWQLKDKCETDTCAFSLMSSSLHVCRHAATSWRIADQNNSQSFTLWLELVCFLFSYMSYNWSNYEEARWTNCAVGLWSQ